MHTSNDISESGSGASELQLGNEEGSLYWQGSSRESQSSITKIMRSLMKANTARVMMGHDLSSPRPTCGAVAVVRAINLVAKNYAISHGLRDRAGTRSRAPAPAIGLVTCSPMDPAARYLRQSSVLFSPQHHIYSSLSRLPVKAMLHRHGPVRCYRVRNYDCSS